MITMPGFKIFQCHYSIRYHAARIANQTPLLTTKKKSYGAGTGTTAGI
jgi:hypothetical protein